MARSLTDSPAAPLAFGPLITPRDILARTPGSGIEAHDAEALEALTVTARYVAEFLSSDHVQLGRAGAVCPFVASALEQGQIRLTACSLEAPDEAAVAAGMARLSEMLDRLGAGNRAIVAVFPRNSEQAASAMVERVQKALKPDFIAREQMIGQFYPGCPAPGLWNADFRPLQTPVASLAVRNITVFDAPFMLERQAYVDAFIRLFGEAGAMRIAKARDAKVRNDRLRASGCPDRTSVSAEPVGETPGVDLRAVDADVAAGH